MKNCPSCGYQNEEQQSFCHQCGTGLQISLSDFLQKHGLAEFLGPLQEREVDSLHELQSLLASGAQSFAYGDIVRLRKALEAGFPNGEIVPAPSKVQVIDQQEMELKMQQAEDLIVKEDYRAAHEILEKIREGSLHSGEFVQLYVFASAHVAPIKALNALRNSSWSDPHRYFLEFCLEKNDSHLLRIINEVRENYPETALGSLMDSVHCLMKAAKNAKPGIAEKAREYFDSIPEGFGFEASRKGLKAVLEWSCDTFQSEPLLDDGDYLTPKLKSIIHDLKKYGVISLFRRKGPFLTEDLLKVEKEVDSQP